MPRWWTWRSDRQLGWFVMWFLLSQADAADGDRGIKEIVREDAAVRRLVGSTWPDADGRRRGRPGHRVHRERSAAPAPDRGGQLMRGRLASTARSQHGTRSRSSRQIPRHRRLLAVPRHSWSTRSPRSARGVSRARRPRGREVRILGPIGTLDDWPLVVGARPSPAGPVHDHGFESRARRSASTVAACLNSPFTKIPMTVGYDPPSPGDSESSCAHAERLQGGRAGAASHGRGGAP